MRMNYEAPTAKFIGFAPAETIAADWDWSAQFADETTETSSMFDIPVDNNQEGNFN